MSASRVLILIAVICFILAAVGVPVLGVGLVPLGLALWAGAKLVGGENS